MATQTNQTGAALTQYQKAFQPVAAQAVAEALEAIQRQEHESKEAAA